MGGMWWLPYILIVNMKRVCFYNNKVCELFTFACVCGGGGEVWGSGGWRWCVCVCVCVCV